MKLNILTCIFLLVLFSSASYAEKIYLKNGSVIDAPIVNRDHASITVKQGMIFKKYYNDQISKIEGGQSAVTANLDASQAVLEDFGGISTVKADLIIKLIEITGVKRNLEKNFDQILANAPQGRYEEFKGLLDVQDLIGKMVPIYAQYYSEDDLRKLIEFYQSPIGQKSMETMPKIAQEIITMSYQYFQEKSGQQ